MSPALAIRFFMTEPQGSPLLLSPNIKYLNLPVSQNIKMKRKPLFSILGIIHDVPLGMLSSKLSRTTLTLTEVLTCPPSEKAWLRPTKPITSPKALPLLPEQAQNLLCFLHNTWVKISYRNECILFSLMTTPPLSWAVLILKDTLLILTWTKFPQQWFCQLLFFLVQGQESIIPFMLDPWDYNCPY